MTTARDSTLNPDSRPNNMSVNGVTTDTAFLSAQQLELEKKLEKLYAEKLNSKACEYLDDEDWLHDRICEWNLWEEIAAIAKGNEDAGYALRKILWARAYNTAKRTVQYPNEEDL